jgi:hypothetical protein
VWNVPDGHGISLSYAMTTIEWVASIAVFALAIVFYQWLVGFGRESGLK